MNRDSRDNPQDQDADECRRWPGSPYRHEHPDGHRIGHDHRGSPYRHRMGHYRHDPYEADECRDPWDADRSAPADLADPDRPADPAKPLRVVHVGQSMVRAGIEQWLKGLIRFLDPARVKLERCVATVPELVDPEVVAEMGVPVSVGKADAVREAARDCDVLLCWGPHELGRWIEDIERPLCVFVAHGEGRWTRHILDGCARVLDHVVAVSPRVLRRVCDGFPGTVIPNGVDAAHLARSRTRAETRRALGFHDDDFILGYIGRFSPEKRPEVVIDAVARLPHRFKALLVGWGAMYHELLDRANRLIPGRYAFAFANRGVGDYYQALDALCLPSEEEGFGLVVLEAMMCGRPVIATEVGYVPELIRDRINGLVVSGSPNSVRDAAELLHRYPDWARGLADEARAMAEEHGHARLMARRYEDLLLRLWARRQQARPATATPGQGG
jgi:glycosyltransferase involved in cell wall biosynthesis